MHDANVDSTDSPAAAERDKATGDTGRGRRPRPKPSITGVLTGKYIRVGDKLYRTADDRRPVVKIEPDRLKTSNLDAIPDLLRIARANGWTGVRISGGDRFKKAAFLAAAAQGLTVENYKPSKKLLAEAERLRERTARRNSRMADAGPAAAGNTAEAYDYTALSERFLRQSHQENARDPELSRAQRVFAQAIAVATARHAHDPARATAESETKRREIAAAISRGEMSPLRRQPTVPTTVAPENPLRTDRQRSR